MSTNTGKCSPFSSLFHASHHPFSHSSHHPFPTRLTIPFPTPLTIPISHPFTIPFPPTFWPLSPSSYTLLLPLCSTPLTISLFTPFLSLSQPPPLSHPFPTPNIRTQYWCRVHTTKREDTLSHGFVSESRDTEHSLDMWHVTGQTAFPSYMACCPTAFQSYIIKQCKTVVMLFLVLAKSHMAW